ncbi:MAG: FG-GAP-like repeat-containing protein, partial [Bacteroidia bacterium]
MKKILLLVSLIALNKVNAQICFGTPTTFSVNGSPVSAASADLNSDGKIDIVTTNPNTSDISVLLGDGVGGFGTPNNISTGPGTQPQMIALADFDGDGKLDVATANAGTNSISILIGNGTGSFGSVANYTISGANGTTGIAAGDFNGDSKSDVVVTNTASGDLAVMLNSGTGTFPTSTSYTAGTAPFNVICNDFNNDSYTDLAVTNYSSGNVSVLLGNGSGGFGATANFAVGIQPKRITSADFNNDGNLDIIASNYGSADFSVLLGNGTGSFSSAITNAVPAFAIATGDFNADGQLDLAGAAIGTSNLYIMLGNGTGAFASPSNFATGGSGGCFILSADYDSDSKPDVAIINQTSNDISALLSTTFTISVSGINTICDGSSTNLVGNGAVNYNWSTGGTANNENFSPNVTTSYTLTGDNGAGCTAIQEFTVIVNPLPAVTIGGGGSICLGGTTIITAAGASAYSWMPATGLNSVTIYNPAASPTVTTDYTVTGTDVNGCTNTATISIPVNPLPVITVNPTNVTCYGACDGIAAASGADFYSWSPGGGTTATITGLCPGTYSVTGTEAVYGCSDTYTTMIVESSSPLNTGFLNIVNASCPGVNNGSVDGNPTGGTAPYSYSWSNGATSQNNSGLGPNNYTLTVTDAYGCSVPGVVSIIAGGAAPSGTITASTTTACQQQPITLHGGIYAGTTGPYTYAWYDYQLGWSQVSSVDSCIVSPTMTGNDSILFQITDANGCVGDTTQLVFINYSDSLSGFVYDTLSNPVTSGSVYLFALKSNHVGMGDTIGIATIQPNGYYVFPNTFYGDYFIMADADTSVYHTAVPTYYGTSPNAYQWDSATVVNHYTCGAGNSGGHNINLIQMPGNLNGPGQISGTITQGPGYGQRIGHGMNAPMGAPLKGVDIKLGKNPGGSPAARTTTDNNGNYQFSNIPVGNYKIYVNIPNYGMDSVLAITITPTNTTSTNNNYYVDSTSVRVDTCIVPSVTYTMVADATPSVWDVFP